MPPQKLTQRVSVAIEILEIEENNYHILVPIKINQICGDAVIDTGASLTVADKKLFTELPPPLSGSEHQSGGITGEIKEVTLLQPAVIEIQGNVLEFPQIAVLDLDYINQMYTHCKQRKIIGLLGCDFCVRQKAVINFRTKTLQFKI